MIRINPYPEKENLCDKNIFRILKDVCNTKNSEKIIKLKRLLSLLEEK